jgi:hypothetical protein
MLYCTPLVEQFLFFCREADVRQVDGAGVERPFLVAILVFVAFVVHCL